MLNILSKCAFVNLFKYPRNITLLHDTLVTCGLELSSRQLNILTKNSKFTDIGLSIVLLRFRRINVVSSLAVNWKFLWQVNCGGFGHWLNSLAWLSKGTPAETTHLRNLSRTGSLKKHEKYSNYFWFILWRALEIFFTFLRAIRLGLTILPILMLYPLALISIPLKNIWYKLLLFSLESSGPIFIKLGQWASTRRDLFSEELCSRLEKLQRRNAPHSWFYTSKSFERVFGPNWQNFLWLDNGGQPVGSGCCAQVYKGWVDFDIVMAQEEESRLAGTNCNGDNLEEQSSCGVEVLEMFGIGSFLSYFQTLNIIKEEEKGKKLVAVAIKVLHPSIITTLRRDLYIMKAAANLVTWMVPSLKWISLPECVDDFTLLMKAQVDFCIEASNLDKFAENFAGVKAVRFPRPFWSLTKPFVMVETYEEGRPMECYINNDQTTETNIKIADIGVNALLKMVFDDNFAHGDLHPGNLLIRDPQIDSCEHTVCPWWKFKKKRKTQPELCLVILDCGIVVSLDARGRKLLRQVFRAVATGEGDLVAELFLNNSTHQCPDHGRFKEAMRALVNTAHLQTTKLSGIEVSSLIAELFATMIYHKVKMDGCFSSVILALMVVEGMGRSLDPSINLMVTAKSYLFKPFLI